VQGAEDKHARLRVRQLVLPHKARKEWGACRRPPCKGTGKVQKSRRTPLPCLSHSSTLLVHLYPLDDVQTRGCAQLELGALCAQCVQACVGARRQGGVSRGRAQRAQQERAGRLFRPAGTLSRAPAPSLPSGAACPLTLAYGSPRYSLLL